MPRALRRAQLAQRLGFDLADALARDIELLAYLFQRMLAVATDPEAQADDFLFFWRKSLQDGRRLLADVRVDDRIHGRGHPTVLDQVAQRRLAIAADGRFERN